MKSLSDHPVLITGAAGGIGTATTRAFAKAGRPIIAHARNQRDGFEEQLSALSQEYDVEIRPLYFDLTDTDAMKKAVQGLFKEKIFPTTLVNNAGVSHGSLFQMTPIAQVRNVFEINLFSAMELTQLVLRGMQRKGEGCIVNVASTLGIDLQPGNSAYGVSKAAVAAWTKTLAAELGGLGIRVNAVAPTMTDTPMVKTMEERTGQEILDGSALGRLAKPEEIASVIAFLASDEASFINGQVIRIDGGRGSWLSKSYNEKRRS